ncbi:unnamed protein product [Phytomonas sp. EM1]|nr:unnamed protein product [Phytomonas sp. EM1]|eukprot:CCW62941.1 unnamed protein product [Phytomonas sp. isolate EM1]
MLPLSTFRSRRSWGVCCCPQSLRFPSRALIAVGASPCIPETLTTSRLSVSFLSDRISDAVGKSINRLTNRVFQDEKLVTESRRKLEKVASTSEKLAERLDRQRRVGQHCVPIAIRVDKSKQYIYFTWRVEVLTAQENRTPEQPSRSMNSTSEAESNLATAERGEQLTADKHVTHALAEYLRAYTSSTDGSYANSNILIYGRRGITIEHVFPVGNYGLRIVFSDGHTGGIFSYEYLYFLTCSENKYGLMRDYIKQLRVKRKSRDPPRRMPSRRELPKGKRP